MTDIFGFEKTLDSCGASKKSTRDYWRKRTKYDGKIIYIVSKRPEELLGNICYIIEIVENGKSIDDLSGYGMEYKKMFRTANSAKQWVNKTLSHMFGDENER